MNYHGHEVSRAYRLLLIASQLPEGRWIGVHELMGRLRENGVTVTQRTIQRDLNEMLGMFPIESQKASPKGWRWRKDAPVNVVSASRRFTTLDSHVTP